MIALRLIVGAFCIVFYCNQAVAMNPKEQKIVEQSQRNLLAYEQWGPRELPLSRLAALELDARAFKEDFQEQSLQFPHLAGLTTLKLLYYYFGQLMIMEKPTALGAAWNSTKKLVVPFPSLESLHINHAGLESLLLHSDRPNDFSDLAKLDVAHNKLFMVPSFVTSDARMPVCHVDCSHNVISSIRPEVLRKISIVLLAHNCINTRTLTINPEDRCQELDVSHNRILSAVIASNNLRKLNLTNVALGKIINNAYYLQELLLADNNLVFDLVKLPRERFAILANNQAWAFTKLFRLELKGNTIKNISLTTYYQRLEKEKAKNAANAAKNINYL